MTKQEKLNQLESLESTIDSCLHEIKSIVPTVDINPYDRIQDQIEDEMAHLQSQIEFEEY